MTGDWQWAYQLDCWKTPPFFGCQLGVPQVNDENETVRRAGVPHFVLEAVVEDDKLAFFPCPRLVSHPQCKSFRNNEAKVGADSAIGWSRVSPDVRSRMHHAELHLATSAQRWRVHFNQCTRFGRLRKTVNDQLKPSATVCLK